MRHAYVTGASAIGVVLVFLASGAASVSTRPDAVTVLSTSGSVDGVRLTLSVANRLYPRDALIDASVRVQNGANREVSARGTSCTQTNPYVDDLSASGHVLYPNGIGWIHLLPNCGATTEDTFMPPGYDAVYHVVTIAQRPVLRASMWIRPTNTDVQVIAAAPPLTIRLGPANPPAVHVIQIRGGVGIRLDPDGRPKGVIHYVSLAHCYRGSDTFDYLGVFWSSMESQTIPANCANPSSWRVIAGWFGRSAAFVWYRQRVSLPPY